MSLVYNEYYFNNNGASATTATTNVLFKVDVHTFESYGLVIQNGASATDVIGVTIQTSHDNSSGHNGAPSWVTMPSGSFPQKGATLGATATLATTAIANCARWIQIIGGHSTTGIVPNLKLTVIGTKAR
jgi:hypothetical protein